MGNRVLSIVVLSLLFFTGIVTLSLTMRDAEGVPTALNDTAPGTNQFVYAELGVAIVLFLILVLLVVAAKRGFT